MVLLCPVGGESLATLTVCNAANGTAADLWKMVERSALNEARSRKILDIDALGRWPGHPEMD